MRHYVHTHTYIVVRVYKAFRLPISFDPTCSQPRVRVYFFAGALPPHSQERRSVHATNVKKPFKRPREAREFRHTRRLRTREKGEPRAMKIRCAT